MARLTGGGGGLLLCDGGMYGHESVFGLSSPSLFDMTLSGRGEFGIDFTS